MLYCIFDKEYNKFSLKANKQDATAYVMHTV